ncbi:MAG TPA: S9 family peptidase [Candidatus Krumholzibacteria bacterium]|nr:S9 family peptidase [Candidatus Krumholzibacteria bacterium]HPD70494.1 S9 family peptidase [Candidatus Krumholzibacteria bacterium]HRY39806.1 S9 family peptidase [Candidatus Krumholzibacteria bacterium]
MLRRRPVSRLVHWALLALLVAAVPVARAQEAPADYTLEDFLETPTIGALAVSPDGAQVAWTRTRRDLAKDERLSELWLGDRSGTRSRRLTWQSEGTAGLAWRGDGALSFLRAVDEKMQVWINPLDGSEPRPVTDFAEGVQSYWWSPDGSWLAVLAPRGDAADDQDDDSNDDAPDDPAHDADDDAATGESGEDEAAARADWTVFDRLEQPDEFPQLWLVPAGDWSTPRDDRAPRCLKEPPCHVYHAAWSPDGATLAVTYNPRFSSLVDEEQRVALVDVASGAWTDVSDPERHASFAAFSPDGRRLAFFTDREAGFRAYLNLKDLVVCDLATRATEVLTPGTQLALGGTGSTPAGPPVWSADGATLYLDAAEGTRHDLYRVTVQDRTLAAVTRLAGDLALWSIRGGTLAYVETALHLPGTLFARSLAQDRPQVLDTVNDSVAEFDLRPPLALELPGKDGVTVEGFLFLPPGAGEADRLPGIVEMHGGPFSRYGNAWSARYPWHVLSRHGFAVFIANPRGGVGYGEAFLRGVYRNFGTDDYDDLMAAVDALVARGTMDPDRLGFTGYSYGGLMTNAVISRTDRFRCAVSIAGIFNYTSALGQSNPQLFIDAYRQPWAADLPRLWDHSPASRAARITTPTLVMHGLDDEPVDPRQSIELFTYLQLNGVPSRLVLYPGEGHGINKPSHMLDYETRELDWFRHYLLGDETAAGAEPPVPVEPTARSQ